MDYEIILKEIGKRINSVRKERRLTQEKLAEKMNVSLQMISNLEQGKKAIRPENLIKLCNVLEVSADYILMGKKNIVQENVLADKISTLPEEKKKVIDIIIDSWN